MSIADERDALLLQARIDADPDVIAATAALSEAAVKLAIASEYFNRHHPNAGMFLDDARTGCSPRELQIAAMESQANLRALRAANEEHGKAFSHHARTIAEVRRRLILESEEST